MMRRILISSLGGLVLILAVWLGRPVTPHDLSITAQNSSASVCVAPELPSLIEFQKGQGGCTKAGGCYNAERVAATYLAETFASLAAYRVEQRFVPEHLGSGWTRVERSELYWSGLAWDVYEHKPARGAVRVMVAFRGTDTFWGYVPYLNDAIANLSTLTQFFNPWDQYRQARQDFQGIRDRALRRAQGHPVSFLTTGHSLGGGIAKHIALGFPCTNAVVINASCIINRWRYQAQRDPVIVGLEEDRDWLTHNICRGINAMTGKSTDRLYTTNWVRNQAGDLAGEINLTIAQHSIRPAAAGMTRGILCCAQRERQNSGNPACGCAENVKTALADAQKVFCSEGPGDRGDEFARTRLRTRQANVCDFTANPAALSRRIRAANNPACPSICGGGAGDGTTN